MVWMGASPHRYTSDKSAACRWTKAVERTSTTHFVVESPFLVEEVEESLVHLSSPEVHVCNLKVAPDCAQWLARAMGIQSDMR